MKARCRLKKLLKRLVNYVISLVSQLHSADLFALHSFPLYNHTLPHTFTPSPTFNPPPTQTHPNPSSSFTHMQELQHRREEELSSLQEQLAELTAQLETLDLNMRKYTTGLQQMVERQNHREAQNKEEEEAYCVKKRTFDLLPNAEDNIAKLQVHSRP